MAVPEIKIKVGADTSGLKSGLDDAGSAVDKFARAAENAGSDTGDVFDKAGDRIKRGFGAMAGSVIRDIASMAGPAALASAALSAAFAAAQSYISGVLDKTPQVDEALEKHSEIIKSLKAAYGDALTGLDQYMKESEDSFRNRLGASITLLQAQLQGLGASFVDALGGTVIQNEIFNLSGELEKLGGTVIQLPARLEPFRKAIEDFQQSVRAGNPDFVTFRNEVDRIGAAAAGTNPEVNRTAVALAEAASRGYQAQQGIGAASSAFSQLAPEARKAAEAVSAYNTALAAMNSLAEKPKSNRYKADENYLQAIFNASGDENKIRQAVQARNAAIARIEEEEAEKTKPARGGGGSKIDPLEAERANIEARLQIIRDGLMSREQIEADARIRDEALIAEAFQKKILTEQEKNALLEQMKAEHLAKLEAMEAAAQQRGLDLMMKGGKALASAFEGNSKKMTGVAKTFGAVEALINAFRAFNQVLADPTLPWFAKIGAAASVLAAGIQTVNAIKSISSSGSSGGGRGGGGGYSGSGSVAAPSAPAQAGKSMYVTLQGDVFNREMVRGLMEQIQAFQKDGGGKVIFA
jgi:hypothetical protein